MFTPSGKLCGRVADIINDRLYLCSFYDHPKSDNQTWYYCVDDDVHYDSFYCDFGPLNLSVLYRFCVKLNERLKALEGKKIIVIYSGPTDEARANTAYLVGAYAIIYLMMSAEIAYLRVHKAEPCGFIGFRDASMGPPTYRLHLHSVLKGVEKAFKFRWLRFDQFDPDEYEFYEKVENGDLNWIIPNKILSFCGPHNRSIIENGYPYHSPEVYFDYFKSHNVSTIIRLNKRMYDAKRFTKAGFEHVDLFFVDGSTPSNEIVERFINVVDSAKGAVAVHCKAGLGRTGTLIGCWMMKEYGVTAAESMAWLRICRPGSVIGPQQQFLIGKQPWCWAMGSAKGSVVSCSYLSGLTSKVDEIRLADSSKSNVLRPLPGLENDQQPNTVDEECATDEMGRTQGDRLLAMKAKAQHHVVARFSSPTTPIKPVLMVPARVSYGCNPQLVRCGMRGTPIPISRVTVMSVCARPPTVKSKASRRLSGLRSKPYPHSAVKVQITPTVYDLRPRANSSLDSSKIGGPKPDVYSGTRQKKRLK